MTDDYDDSYLKLDASKVEITDETGKDVTARFNIQDKDGVLYAYAKTVDTEVPATGETVKGDPQPTDLKAYSESDEHNPLTQPSIDQTLLGHTYTATMPMTVIKVTDGYVVRNKATQVLNKVRKDTNEVTNPLKPVNPSKDVTVKVGGESVNGRSIYKGRTFLYQLDSSILPAHRATRRWTSGTSRTRSTRRSTNSRASGSCTRAATCTGTARSSPPRARRSPAAASTARGSAATCSRSPRPAWTDATS